MSAAYQIQGWRRRESNPRPLPCDGSALPTELRPQDKSIFYLRLANCQRPITSLFGARLFWQLFEQAILSMIFIPVPEKSSTNALLCAGKNAGGVEGGGEALVYRAALLSEHCRKAQVVGMVEHLLVLLARHSACQVAALLAHKRIGRVLIHDRDRHIAHRLPHQV